MTNSASVSWPHTDGEEYYTLIDEFMAAVKLRWPRALIQFEDFQSKHAIATLKRYRKEYLMFNDDIQVAVRENQGGRAQHDFNPAWLVPA
jgi:malic enzyme